MLRFTAFAVLTMFASPLPAAVVVLCNATGAQRECEVTVGEQPPRKIVLNVGESRPIQCGKSVTIAYTDQEGPKALRLEPYNAYWFVEKPKIGWELMTIQLAGKAPSDRDVPDAIPDARPLRIPVKLMVDETERRTRQVWSRVLKKRLEAASEIMQREAGVVFEVAENEDWRGDPQAASLESLAMDFENRIDPKPGVIAIGFTSRQFPGEGKGEVRFAVSRGMFATRLLIREDQPRSEPERTEVLVQQLGRYLGAVASPDPISVMRPKLGDGHAIHARWRIGFDPLNCLALNIVSEELRKGPRKPLAEWPEPTQVRLARVYATLQGAVPEERMNDEVNGLLERAGLRVAAAPAPGPDPGLGEMRRPEAAAGRPLLPEQDAVRKVVRAIVIKAQDNARQPAAARLRGDELTDLYIRAAADVASTLEPDFRCKAFLIGIGIGLDDSDMLRKTPVIGELWRAVENEEEKKLRVAVLGNPTVRFRRDHCQHFAVSAALTALGGSDAADRVGLEKERMDMLRPNGSGFSFSDLGANIAGIAFAEHVLKTADSVDRLRRDFSVERFVPKLDDLPDGLSRQRFEQLVGNFDDKRFEELVDKIRKRVRSQDVYRTRKEN